MPVVPSGIVNQRQIGASVQRAAEALAPEVKRIRYELTFDSTGSPAIFFRVLLAERASKLNRIYETTERIAARILDIVQPQERFGIEAYFNFRSESEQATLRDDAWE